MSFLQYPLDYSYLMAKRKKIHKQVMSNIQSPIKKRIAILGGSTTSEIAAMLDLFLLDNNIEVEIYESEYNQYWEDAVFGNKDLESFQPDFIYIHTTFRNIEVFPNIADSPEQVNQLLNSEFNRLSQMWTALNEKYSCPIIQNNFDRPSYRLMGNRDIWDDCGKSSFINKLNQKIYEYAAAHERFYVNDIDYLSAQIGLNKWHSSFYWNMYKYAMSMEAIPYVAKSVSDIVKSLLGKNKKAVALDLDNTLWGGVIGDDGIEGISIGQELPEGQAYYEFQKYCKELKNIGVILTINSKNDEDNALAGLNHPDGVLKPDDFVLIKANWNPKSQNLLETATELNLGIESFVFVDDNPAEREIVNQHLPAVAVPAIGSVDDYIQVLDNTGFFETTILSSEDINKTQTYRENKKRNEFQNSFLNYEDYLDSLKMRAVIKPFDSFHLQRIAQLTNKSNQFNLTTKRCTEKDIEEMSQSNQFITLYLSLSDKFGDNGIVSLAAGGISGDELNIELWLMSCRVLKRNVEAALMNELVRIAKKKSIRTIVGHYYPTPKNGMVKDFYKEMGFMRIKADENGNTDWVLQVEDYSDKKTSIMINN